MSVTGQEIKDRSLDPLASVNSLKLNIPEDTVVCGVFQEGRTLREEYELLSMIYFLPGLYEIPLITGSHPLNLIQRFEFGPERRIAEPMGQGSVQVEITDGIQANARLKYEQDFDVDGTVISLLIDNLWITINDGQPEKEELIFNEPFLSLDLYMLAQMKVGFKTVFLKFASVGYDSLPLYRLSLSLEAGQSIQLYQRWLPPLAGSGPANLVFAMGDIHEGTTIQTDYWSLVYAAEHHNWNERFWMLFDSPMDGAYGIAVLTEDFPSRAEVYTLDENFEPLRQIEVLSFEKVLYDGPFPPETEPPVSIDSWVQY